MNTLTVTLSRYLRQRKCAGNCGHLVYVDDVACKTCLTRFCVPKKLRWELYRGDAPAQARRDVREWMATGRVTSVSLSRPRRGIPGVRLSRPSPHLMKESNLAPQPQGKPSSTATPVRLKAPWVGMDPMRRTMTRVYGPLSQLYRAICHFGGKVPIQVGRNFVNVTIVDVIETDFRLGYASMITASEKENADILARWIEMAMPSND